MRRMSLLGLAAVAAVSLAACQSAGPQVASASISAYASQPGDGQPLAGGLAGVTIGLELSGKDRRTALDAEYRALEYGRTGAAIAWRGRSGSGQVVAGPFYRVNDYDCREYTHTITAKRQSETGHATACRRADGGWQLIS